MALVHFSIQKLTHFQDYRPPTVKNKGFARFSVVPHFGEKWWAV
jgi:hypothetical protein